MSGELNVPVTPEFKPWPKITRFRTLNCRVTEKLDGSNAQIFVPDDPAEPILAASRNRWLLPDAQDNYGFREFVRENSEVLRALGPGRHYGEWWGQGIGRRYGLEEKRLWLFGHERFSGGLPASVVEHFGSRIGLVPILYQGPMDLIAIKAVIDKLYAEGSVAVPGWMKPEGVVIDAVGTRWKVTDNGDQHKGTEAS